MENKSTGNELLKPTNMLRLYAAGAFPMADENTGAINWYMPEIRAIIPLENYNIPRSLKSSLSKLSFEIKFDTETLSVIKGCAERESTWISDELIKAYLRLKKIGCIHSVEAWQNDELVGGLFGVSFRGAFFGESMFSKVSQASKAALEALLKHLVNKGFKVLDVQYLTPHLEMFGAVEINFSDYEALLNEAYLRNCEF
jgi:leucyl/phenylalanyl-tRNA---protein transferase